jgi:hypothetical protein
LHFPFSSLFSLLSSFFTLQAQASQFFPHFTYFFSIHHTLSIFTKFSSFLVVLLCFALIWFYLTLFWFVSFWSDELFRLSKPCWKSRVNILSLDAFVEEKVNDHSLLELHERCQDTKRTQ